MILSLKFCPYIDVMTEFPENEFLLNIKKILTKQKEC